MDTDDVPDEWVDADSRGESLELSEIAEMMEGESNWLVERGRGFLTAADTKWIAALPGEKYDEATRRQKRLRISNRIQNTFRDLNLLYANQDNGRFTREDLLSVFDRDGSSDSPEEMLNRRSFDSGVESALALIYQALGHEEFVKALERAITKAESDTPMRTQLRSDVTVSIESVESVSVGAIATKLYEGDGVAALSNEELSAVLRMMAETGGSMPKSSDEFRDLAADFLDVHLEDTEVTPDDVDGYEVTVRDDDDEKHGQ